MSKIYKLIIVDDEYTGCELLKKYVTDYCKDFEIAGIFRDGDEAISYLLENDVELVLTDIKMPKVSGIELAKFIYSEKPYINVIAVSAYSEFEYAKELMRYGVVYYLLKFVDLDEFLEAMDIVRENLASLKDRNSSDSDEMQAEMFFYDLFENNFPSLSEASLNYNDFERGGDFLQAECIKFSAVLRNLGDFIENKWHYTEEMLKNAVVNIIKLMNSHLFIFCSSFVGDKINFVVFDHGKPVKLDTGFITKELSSSFGLEVEITECRRIMLKDVYDGEYGENIEIPDSDDIDIHSARLPAIVKAAVEIIEKNYNKPIMRDEIADQIHVNVVYLSKSFKKYTGKTIMSYLCECRMKVAAELVTKEKTISEICAKIGYNDERAFRRAFKRYTGFSVREYKKHFSIKKGE